MAVRNYIDNAPQTTLPGAIGASDLAITVASLAGYPTAYPYTVTLGLGSPSAEQILVTSLASGSTVNVTRNYNGQGAFTHPAGETVNLTAVAKDFTEANSHVNATQAIHGLGASSSVVGTIDTQTLTNKTLTTPTIASILNTGTLTLPTSTDTLVGRATTDTLSNKTLTNPLATGDATHPAVTAQATGATGKTLSLTNSSAVEVASVDYTGAAVVKTVTSTGGLSQFQGDTTVGIGLQVIPGKAGTAFRTLNVANNAVNFSVDDVGNVVAAGGVTTTGNVSSTAGTGSFHGVVTQPASADTEHTISAKNHLGAEVAWLTGAGVLTALAVQPGSASAMMQGLNFGTFTITWSANTVATGTVTFPSAMPNTPIVLTDCGSFTGNSQTVVDVTATSTTNFTYRAVIPSSASGSVTGYYIAVC